MKSRVLFTGMLGAALALSACVPDEMSPVQTGSPALNEGEEELTLTIISDLTAVGSWDRTQTYSWSIAHTPDAAALPIAIGETKSIMYDLDVDRTVSIVDDFNSKGKVCLTTYYGVPQNLNITGTIQYYDPELSGGEGGWVAIPSATNEVDMGNPHNEGTDEYGGQITCYKYKASMGSEPHQTVDWLGYQYVSLVFISNLLWGEDYLEARKNFYLPTEPDIKNVNATASLTSVLFCPAGFTCGSLPTELQSTVALNDSRDWSYSLNVTNVTGAEGAHRVRSRGTLSIDGPQGGGQANADTWMEVGANSNAWSCNSGFWADNGSAYYWTNHGRNDHVGTVFAEANRYSHGSKLLSEEKLSKALTWDSSEGETPLAGAAMDLIREGTARVLNLEFQGGDVPGVRALVNAALASENRISMIELSGQLRAENFVGVCRLQ